MFQAGTRVYVLGSSVAGKKLGPKRHSLGYISNTNMAYIMQPVKNFPIDKQLFVLFPLKVVFTRYGKENRERCEHRDFLHVMPLFSDSPHKVNAGRIQEVLRILRGGELSKNSMWYDVGCNYSNNPNNLGTLLPIRDNIVSELKGNEALAWVESILRNDTFKHLLSHNKNLPTLHAIANTDVVNWVSNALRGSSPRRDLLRWATDEASNMRQLVRTLRCLTTAFEKRISKSQENIKSVSLESNSYLTWLMDKMFHDERTLDHKMVIARKLGLSSALQHMTKNNKLVRDTYLSLKPKHV